MKKIRIEKVGDISSRYSYLEIYFESGNKPFMEISVTDDKELLFKVYQNDYAIELSVQEWEQIQEIGKQFLPEAVKDEEGFNSLMGDI